MVFVQAQGHGSGHGRRRGPRARALASALVAMAVVGTAMIGPLRSASAGVPVDVRVDFSAPVAPTPPSSVGFTATTFGVDDGTVVQSAAARASLHQLGAGAVRIHLAPDGSGRITSGAGGGDRTATADAWLDAYDAVGVAPTVIVNLDVQDALAVLQDVRANGHLVRRYIVGNEMDANSKSNVAAATYVQRFREVAKAMRAVDPSLEIGGPAPAYFEGATNELVDGLVRAPSAAEKASFIDYHAYGSGQGTPATKEAAWRYASQISALRAAIADPSVGIQVGEFNMNWGDEPQNNTQFQAEWVATALGTIISNGATAFQYGDKNDAMGLVGAAGAPKASYRGMQMFTGAGLFGGFGRTAVAASSDSADVRAFASTDQERVVLVNFGAATSAHLDLQGFGAGTVVQWSQQDLAAPEQVATARIGSSWTASLPARSISTFELTRGGAAPSTTTAPTTAEPTTTSTLSVPPTTTGAPTTAPKAPKKMTHHGLVGEYFDTADLTGPSVRRIDPQIDFPWSWASPGLGIDGETFSVRWSGYLLIDRAGTYTFRTTSDDGIRLRIDGKSVIEAWNDHSRRDDSGTIRLTRGKHRIVVEFYDNRYEAFAVLSWQGPGVSGVVPSSRLTTS